ALGQRIDTVQASVTQQGNELSAAVQSLSKAQSDGDKALGQRIDTVQASVTQQGNELSAAVQTVASAVASLDGEVEAGWYTKAQISGEGGGFGLSVTLNPDGSVMSSFIVAADVFAIMSRASGESSKRHPFVVKNGSVYMNHALMDTAEIGNVIAKYINVQHLVGSLIEGGSFRGGDIWLGENPNGAFSAYGKRWNAGIDSNGRFYGSDVYFTNGTFQGNVLANSGTMNNVTMRENCQILGKLDVNQVDGDVVKMARGPANLFVAAYRRARVMPCIRPVNATAAVSGQGVIGCTLVCKVNGAVVDEYAATASYPTGGKHYFNLSIQPAIELPANVDASVTFEVVMTSGTQLSEVSFNGNATWLIAIK
ncbi:phage tail tip fiber protein, partial [Aeromonas veronii]|uniref:phage tail tip fiber protein n=1 Tax=Aeromonas veronii TaxID=654 RepID=UPI003D1BC0D9